MAQNVVKTSMKIVKAGAWLIRKKLWVNRRVHSPGKPQGRKGIRQLGHREYVGGLWKEIGKLQFKFLVQEGLEPDHYLCDIGCGSLRAGIHFIPYLNPGHYLGIEKEKDLVQAGIDKELGRKLYELRKPQFVISDSFEVELFTARPHYMIAQSLFTHLPPALIETCLRKLRQFTCDNGRFYATFNEVPAELKNPDEPHDHGYFGYTREQMEKFGSCNGWHAEYIGGWNHPRGQNMVRYRPS